MPPRLVPCRLYAPDGVLLTTGLARLDATSRTVVGALDRPGSIVQRLLLGGLRSVRVQLSEADERDAQVERVFYDAKLGRACSLTVAA